jgi:hypothetical protein
MANEDINKEMLELLEGIVHFSDGFVVYSKDGPVGDELRKWIEAARSTIADADPERFKVDPIMGNHEHCLREHLAGNSYTAGDGAAKELSRYYHEAVAEGPEAVEQFMRNCAE